MTFDPIVSIPKPRTEYPEYEPDALFRCRRGHGAQRRDRLGSYRGQLYCPRCGHGLFPDLEFIGRANTDQPPI